MEFNATFLVAAISFIIFTLIMEKIFYHPVSVIINKRKLYFEENESSKTNNELAAKKIREDKDKDILASKTEAKNVIMSEVENANKEKEEKESSLKEKISEQVNQQKVALNNEKEINSKEMKTNLEDISNSILSKLIGDRN